ncbi:hypothetical protein D2F01_22745 [Mycobacteroides abscessus]|nr:hypothetical protein D2F01_22745 [Mycobacteroides abscessus]
MSEKSLTYLRPAQVEAQYPVKANHLAQLRHQGLGPRYIKRGRLIAYRASDIEQWLNDGLVEPHRPAVPDPSPRRRKVSA